MADSPMAACSAAFPDPKGWTALQLLQTLESPGLAPELAIALCLAWQRQAPVADHYVALFQLAALHQRLAQTARAIELYRECLAHRDLAPARFNLAMLYEQQGRLDEAGELLYRLASPSQEAGLRRQSLIALQRLARLQGDWQRAAGLLNSLEAVGGGEGERLQLQRLRDELRFEASDAPEQQSLEPLRIIVLAVCFNEAPILPFFIEHYLQHVGATRIVLHDGGSSDGTAELVARYPQVELVVKKSDKLDDRELMAIRNEAWKPLRDEADWMIVCDVDEFLYHPQMKSELRRLRRDGITLPMVEGFEMLSKTFPQHQPERLIWQDVQAGFPVPNYYNKNLIFDPRIDINYTLGCHGCQPTGPVQRSKGFVFRNLHYRMLSHAHIVAKSQRAAARLSEWNQQTNAGFHYRQHAVMPMADYNRQFLAAANVVQPRLRPVWDEARQQLFDFLCGLPGPAQTLQLGDVDHWLAWSAWYQHAFGGCQWLLEPDARRMRHGQFDLRRRGLASAGQHWLESETEAAGQIAAGSIDLLIVTPGDPLGDADDQRRNAEQISARVGALLPLLADGARLLLAAAISSPGDPYQRLRPWLAEQGWTAQTLGDSSLLRRL